MLYCKKQQDLSHAVLLLQLIPARGRKPHRLHDQRHVFSFNLSPRGDGNLLLYSSILILSTVSTYPREGTETPPVLSYSTGQPVSTYPREGTETQYTRWECIPCIWFQLIPARGRKRRIGHVSGMLEVGFQLIPARGRKLIAQLIDSHFIHVSTYPREGTETHIKRSASSLHTGFNLSPRGDGNSAKVCGSRVFQGFNLSPRGDGNKLNFRVQSVNRGFNLSPRGDGNFLLQKGVLGGKAFLLQLIPARGQKPLVIRGQNRI